MDPRSNDKSTLPRRKHRASRHAEGSLNPYETIPDCPVSKRRLAVAASRAITPSRGQSTSA